MSSQEQDLEALCEMLEEEEPDQEKKEEARQYRTKANEPSDDPDNLKEQMRQMQEQMKLLQEKLAAAEGTNKTARTDNPDDIFSRSGSSGRNAPRSPVKTNPFAEVKVTDKRTKMWNSANRFGPSLPVKTPDRKIEGAEKRELLEQLKKKDLERRERLDMVSKVAQDLQDSSDEEAERSGNSNYNEFGRDIKRQLKTESSDQSTSFSNLKGTYMNLSDSKANKALPGKSFIESHTKLRIANALIDQTKLNLNLVGRKLISICRLRNAVTAKETEGDWVTIGVIFHKSSQTSKNGNTYTIWRMTDLQAGSGTDFKTLSVFLFGKCHSKHYSMPMNKVVGILNPKIMADKSGRGEVSVSIDHPDKVMEMGDSMDVGKCQGKRADGTGCTALVNKSCVEYCSFHVKKAYNNLSAKRSDLQSSFSGNAGVRDRIMSKIAPKSEVFAGGQILNTNVVHGKVSANQKSRDSKVLAKLGVPATSSRPLQNNLTKKKNVLHEKLFNSSPTASTIGLEKVEKKVLEKAVEKVKSDDLGAKLLNPTPGSRQLMRHLVNEELPKTSATQSQLLTRDEELVLQKQRMAENQSLAKSLLSETKEKERKQPMLGRGLKSGDFIDLTAPKSVPIDRARALQILKGKEIKKVDPNYVMRRKRSRDDLEASEKKVASVIAGKEDEGVGHQDDDGVQSPSSSCEPEIKPIEKKPRVFRSFSGEIIDEEKIAALRAKKSSKQHLADEHETEEEDRYFDKLEKKEAMEEKMIATKEITSKVVTCAACNYTSFTQSDICRSMGHAVKHITAKKRFFQCKNCKKRTFAFDKYPKKACSNCGGSAWERTGMMRERKGPTLDSEKLLIRGQEQKFIGANVDSSQLNLHSLDE